MIENVYFSRNDKIAFILSLRATQEKMNNEFYKYLVSEYKKISDDELNIEFEFYFNEGK